MARFMDKVVAITGGGSGIGKETAKRFVAEGAKVVINGRDEAKLKAAASEIDPTGEKVAISVGDIADPATGQALVDTAQGANPRRLTVGLDSNRLALLLAVPALPHLATSLVRPARRSRCRAGMHAQLPASAHEPDNDAESGRSRPGRERRDRSRRRNPDTGHAS